MPSKLQATLNSHLFHPACAQLIVGSNMDEGIVKYLLSVLAHNPKAAEKLCLLSGAKLAPESIGFAMPSIPAPHAIFQRLSIQAPSSEQSADSPDVSESPAPSDGQQHGHYKDANAPKPSDTTNGQPATNKKPPNPAPVKNSWADIVKQPTPEPILVAEPLPAAPSRASRHSSTGSTWDTMAANKKSKVHTRKVSSGSNFMTDILETCEQDEDGIWWTETGRRIDPVPAKYNKDEVDRVKKLKLCNVHYLRGPCPYDQALKHPKVNKHTKDGKCTHRHDYKATKAELETLALVARMAPCSNGMECEDGPCIYGHVCPAPRQTNLHKLKGGPTAIAEGKLCIFGVECRFDTKMHVYDLID
ncbi:hypothetical protein BT63DRAFT_427461, partial [Microthyrium microscopicum]